MYVYESPQAQAAKKASKPADLRDTDVAEDQALPQHATFDKVQFKYEKPCKILLIRIN